MLTLRSIFQYLNDRRGHLRSRAEGLLALRMRFSKASKEAFGDEELALSKELLGLRKEIQQTLGVVSSCQGCAKGCELPMGQWDGGFCCSGTSGEVFSDDEVASLAAAGVRGAQLKAPHSEHAGCLFRGPVGCTLDSGQRPNICTWYICRELGKELARRDNRNLLLRQCASLQEIFERFSALRKKRLGQDALSKDEQR